MMTDNARDMVGCENGLVTKVKIIDRNVIEITSICHGTNLILVNLLKWVTKPKKKETNEIVEIESNLKTDEEFELSLHFFVNIIFFYCKILRVNETKNF